MSKLSVASAVPAAYEGSIFRKIIASIQDKLNLLAEGRISARHFTSSSIPTTGSFAQDDIIWKSSVSEEGSASSKYVIIGWVCTVAGSPGTLLEMRVLTGN